MSLPWQAQLDLENQHTDAQAALEEKQKVARLMGAITKAMYGIDPYESTTEDSD